MKLVQYILCIPLTLVVTLLAYLLSPILPFFVDDLTGDLPNFLRWFETPDAPCVGDAMWKNRTVGMSRYKQIFLWLLRNPAQGLDAWLKADINLADPVRVYGDINVRTGNSYHAINSELWKGKGGWLFVTGSGYFNFLGIIPLGGHCVYSEFGWRLRGIADGEPSEICKQFVFTPLRVAKFYKGD